MQEPNKGDGSSLGSQPGLMPEEQMPSIPPSLMTMMAMGMPVLMQAPGHTGSYTSSIPMMMMPASTFSNPDQMEQMGQMGQTGRASYIPNRTVSSLPPPARRATLVGEGVVLYSV